MVDHSEGSTCRKCCRLQPIPYYQAASGEISNQSNPYICWRMMPELEGMVTRHLISLEVANTSKLLFQEMRKANINFPTSTLLIFVIHQAMTEHLGVSYSISQLSSLLDVHFPPHSLLSQYARLCEKFPKVFKIHPFSLTEYIPLQMLFSNPSFRKEIFSNACKLQRESGFIIRLATCVFVLIQNKVGLNLDSELVDFVCNFPKRKHICHAQALLTQKDQKKKPKLTR